MSDLDEKLRASIGQSIQVSKLDKPPELVGSDRIIFSANGMWFELHPNYKAIEQAFKDSGYILIPKDTRDEWAENDKYFGLMDGQDWYDRFEKEYAIISNEGISYERAKVGPSVAAELDYARDYVLAAAKRAAGIE